MKPLLTIFLILSLLFAFNLYAQNYMIDEPDIYANDTDTEKVMWKDDNPALSAITDTTEQKTLEDLVEIKNNEIILKYSIKIPVAGLGEIHFPKGTKIIIEE